MPHAVYFDPFLLCPWDGCDFRIEMIDFRIEKRNDPVVYARIVGSWQLDESYGVMARCPGCSRFVWFGKKLKATAAEPLPAAAEVLPDDWHTIAFIA